MTKVIGGFIGEADVVEVPARSMARIMRTVFDLDERQTGFERQVSFRAIRDVSNVNVSEVTIATVGLDGRQTDQEVRVVYRDGLFRRATIAHHGREHSVPRLSDALGHLLTVNPC